MGPIRAIAAWRIRPTDDFEHHVARHEASRLARSFLRFSDELYANELLLRDLVRSMAPTLLDQVGIGPITAATFLAAWSHPGRMRSEAAFASLAGAAPLPASSGNIIRYRLSRHGDRQLNWALDVVARSRLLCDPDTQAYAARRRAEGKTNKDVRRILKRYIARQIHRQLTSIFTLAPTISDEAGGDGRSARSERLISVARSAAESGVCK